MKVLFFILVVGISVNTFSFATEGDQPYSPTRLEWATVYFRNECGLWFGGIPSLTWGLYNVNGTKDTITITAIYGDPTYRKTAEDAAETCERNMKALAKDKGWTWLKTIRDVRSKFQTR